MMTMAELFARPEKEGQKVGKNKAKKSSCRGGHDYNRR